MSFTEDAVNAKIKPGDVIMKCGYGTISSLIVKFLEEPIPISHCGIIVKDSTENWCVVHSISGSIASEDGVQQVPLKVFLKDVKPTSLYVLRASADASSHELIQQKAIDLARAQVPFDHDFDHQEVEHLYCSEFVQQAYQSTLNISCFSLEKRGDIDILMFNSVLQNPEFEVVGHW